MNSQDNSIREKITAYIQAEYFQDQDQTLGNDTALLSGGIIDSISAMQVVDFLEKTFDFEFEPHEMDNDNLDSIDRLVVFVESKINP